MRLPPAGRAGALTGFAVGLAAGAVLTSGRAAAAQSDDDAARNPRETYETPSALIVGTVRAGTARPALAGALVFVSGTGDATVTDTLGHFRLVVTSLGQRTLSFRHAWLDTLGIAAAAYPVAMRAGDSSTVHMTAPTVRDAAAALCGATLSDGAVLHGVVRDEARDLPLGALPISVRVAGRREPAAGARLHTITDKLGEFRVCGLPAAVPLELVIAHGGHTRRVAIPPSPEGAVLRRDVLFGIPTPRAASIAAARSSTQPAPSGPPEPGGASASPGRIVGVVLDRARRPVPQVEVTDSLASRATETDSLGRFVLDALPASPRTIELRRLGYLAKRVTASAGPRDDTLVFVLDAVPAVLETVRVRARRDATGFAERRERNPGYFLTREELARRGSLDLADVFRGVPGIRLERVNSMLRDAEFVLQFDRGPDIYGGNCPVTFYLDGTQVSMGWSAVSWQVRPADIEAIEIYQGPQVPPRFLGRNARCGVVVIWTTHTAVAPDSTGGS